LRPARPSEGITATTVDDEVRVGRGRLADGDLAGAAHALDRARVKAVAEGGTHRSVLFLAGELALAAMRADDAREAFLALLNAPPEQGSAPPGADGYDLRVRLALAEIHRNDLKAAEEHLRRAVAFDPHSTEAVHLLIELLGDASWRGARDEDRLDAIATMLHLEPLHAKLARELVFGLARRGRAAATVEAATLAIFIEPAVPELHAALARALVAVGKTNDAATAIERALALGPPPEQQSELRRLLTTSGIKPRRERPAGVPPPARR
jgi:tetratricopeptide (TPR) repeat protein